MAVMEFAVDTSAFSSFGRGDQRLRVLFNSAQTMYVPLIVCGELRAGFVAGSHSQSNNHILDSFLDEPYTELLELTEQTTQKYASIFAQLRRQGRPIGTNDIWIAALCLEHNLPLATLDSDFNAVEGLEIVKL